MTPPAAAPRLRAPWAVAGLVVLGAALLRCRDPHQQGSWGVCPYRLLLGLDCPGCGSLRAVSLLTRGDLVGAASSNLLLVVAAPVAVLGWLAWVRRASRGGAAPRLAAAWPVVLAVLVPVVVAFTVLRNTAAGAWLHS